MSSVQSPATSSADTSDDAASQSPLVAEPEEAPLVDEHATFKKKPTPKCTPKPKRDPVEQRAAYLAKRREIKARARSRKRDTAASLTEQHIVLKKQLAVALEKYHANTRAILHERLTEDHGEKLAQLWDAYVEALELQEAITTENQHLVDRVDEFLLVECRLLLPEFNLSQGGDAGDESPIIAEDPIDTRESQLQREASTLLFHDRRGYWTHFQDEYDAPFYFEFYRDTECSAVIARSYQQMQHDLDETARRQWAFSTGCFGWRGFGDIDESDATRVRFQFAKTLARASSSDLLDEITRETCRIFHSPTLYAKLYGMRMESQILQRVDDHSTVILQSLSDEHRTLSLRSFMLFSCIEERLPPTAASHGQARRAMTILNVVLPPRPQDGGHSPTTDHGVVLYMTECLIFMRLEQVDDHQLRVAYGGHAHCLSNELARICVLESVGSFFRWVQRVIPERLVAFN
jgi:hypothetical protein